MTAKQEYSPMPVDDDADAARETNGRKPPLTHNARKDENGWERYGWFAWYPPGQAVLASAPFFLLIMCALIFSDAFNIGTLSGALTSLETRYELKASELGLIESLYEAGNLIFVIFVVHLVGRSYHRRPFWIGLGALIMALGTAVAFSPQFMFAAYEPDSRSFFTNDSAAPLTCRGSDWGPDYELECAASGEQRAIRRDGRVAYAVVVLGEILVGIGWTPVMPLSMSYIDDNLNTKSSAMYIGIIQSMFGVGTIFGFLASAAVAGKWVDFYRVDVDAIKLVPGDNLWVGAWWLGMSITSALYLVSSLPFFGFPRRLRKRPSTSAPDDFMAIESASSAEVIRLDEDLVEPESRNAREFSLYSLPTALAGLMRNPVFMWLNVSSVTETAVIAGLVTFFPKYLETQFGLSPPQANFFMAVVPVPAVALGAVLGGYLVKKVALTAEGATKLALACSLISLVGQMALLGIGCDNTGLAGVDVAYSDNTRVGLSAVNLTSACNVDCGCNSVDPETVCGADGLTYFSACHAGCGEGNNGTYFNCSCVQDPADENDATGGSAWYGACPMASCSTLAPFLVIMFVIALSSSCEEIPQLMVLMRCVKKNDKALALGLRHAFTRIFGNIPAPLYYGAAIDASCRLWQQFCGDRGECWAYSLPDLRYAYMGLTVALKSLNAISYAITWVLLRRRAGGAKGEAAAAASGLSDVGVTGEAVPTASDAEDAGGLIAASSEPGEATKTESPV